MSKLSLLLGLFLSVTMGTLVLVLALVAKVTWNTLVFRTLVSFFGFGVVGVLLGTTLEIFLLSQGSKLEEDNIKKELELADKTVEQELGDLLHHPPDLNPYSDQTPSQTEGSLKPAVFPRLTVENGKVVPRSDSTAVS